MRFPDDIHKREEFDQDEIEIINVMQQAFDISSHNSDDDEFLSKIMNKVNKQSHHAIVDLKVDVDRREKNKLKDYDKKAKSFLVSTIAIAAALVILFNFITIKIVFDGTAAVASDRAIHDIKDYLAKNKEIDIKASIKHFSKILFDFTNGIKTHQTAEPYVIRFESGSYNITKSGYRVVDDVARIAAHTTHCLALTGHSDRSGSVATNQRIATQRAASVKNRLIAKGIARDRISIDSKGETHLPVSTLDGISEPENRRVEIHLAPCTPLGHNTPNL